MKIEIKDIGNTVLCDFCGADFTNSDAVGGFIFHSKGTCPNCAPELEASAKRYNETHYIKERAKIEEKFKDFILRIRNGNNTVQIINF